jgi:quercetin dioxygenase-like cupin family protein
MAVRRVVTGEVEGASRIISDGAVPASPYWEDIWYSAPTEPLGREPDAADTELEALPGAAKWRVFIVPPDEVLKQQMVAALGEEAAASWDGFHKTNTLDYIFVLDGEIGLQMEDGEEVHLRPGDCVVQRATNHAWRNRSDEPVRLLGVMTTLP